MLPRLLERVRSWKPDIGEAVRGLRIGPTMKEISEPIYIIPSSTIVVSVPSFVVEFGSGSET
jgi:hypothetical protein